MQEARRVLVGLRGRSRVWGYRRQGTPSVEPTVLASLGLLASGDEHSFAEDDAAAGAAGGWLTAIQRAEGSLPVSQSLSTPGWATPYGLLLWRGLPAYESARARARAWLLRLEGQTLARTADSQAVIGHDSTAIGWPWVQGTHSWLEPTALAVLALCLEGLADHPRVEEGIGLIRDRSLTGGGWNYGNKVVFGHDLRPQPGPTGLALLALAARGEHPPEAARALDYLRRTLPNLRAGVSLGWGTLGLRAHDACPREAETWLADSYRRSAGRPDAILGLALVLLAACPHSLGLLIATGAKGAARRARSDPPAQPAARPST
jgi:hypothetical protein